MNHGCDAPGLTPLDQALEHLLNITPVINDHERVTIEQACGRVLASPIRSAVNIPAADNSAMDGYALRSTDGTAGQALSVVGRSFAGHPFSGEINRGECVRIMTGAHIPAGADCVIMQEQVQVVDTDRSVLLQRDVSAGANVRVTGEDVALGRVVFESGRCLSAADVGLLSALGIPEIDVMRRLRVALLATGDELKKPGERLSPGQQYESNGYAVAAVLQKLGAEIIDLGIIPDDVAALRKAFAHADTVADVVITSGGVSVGEADFVKNVLDELGEIAFWKLAIKPGKPFAFGFLSKSVFIGLPGNPVSALVTLHQLAIPILRKLAGQSSSQPLRFAASTACAIKKTPGRTDFQRGIYQTDGQGKVTVMTTGSQGSSMLTSLSRANCYIILEQMRGDVDNGETVLIEPFDALMS